MRRQLLNLWLILFLLFNQAGQIAHAASHIQDSHAEGDSPCMLCVAYADHESALPAGSLASLSAGIESWLPTTHVPAVAVPAPTPQARAPPSFL
jgi:hypothetical protein